MSELGKTEFVEDRQAAKLNPLAAPESVEFDWAGLYRSLGEDEDQRDVAIENGARCFRAVAQWVASVRLMRPNALEQVGRRFICALWVLDPSFFESSPSLAQIARDLGCTPHNLAPMTADFSRAFHVRNRAQAHYWGRAP